MRRAAVGEHRVVAAAQGAQQAADRFGAASHPHRFRQRSQPFQIQPALLLEVVEAEQHVALGRQGAAKRLGHRHRQRAQRRRRQGEHADARAPAPRERPRLRRIGAAGGQGERGQQLGLHLHRPDVDVAPALELAKVDQHVVAVDLLPGQPQLEAADLAVQRVDVGRRPGAEHRHLPRFVMVAEGAQEQERAHVAAERLGRQQEQHPASAKAFFGPAGRRQARQAHLAVDHPQRPGAVGQHRAREGRRIGQVEPRPSPLRRRHVVLPELERPRGLERHQGGEGFGPGHRPAFPPSPAPPPGSARGSAPWIGGAARVDGRVKPGHDETGVIAPQGRACRLIPRHPSAPGARSQPRG